MECVEKIISKSLAIVCKIKSFRLHSAYWHLCVKEASKNKFFHVVKNLTNASKEDTVGQRRFAIQHNVLLGMKAVYDSMAATLTTRSLLCTGPDHQYPVPICFDFPLLNILDALAIRFYDFPNEVLKLVRLRYLGLTHNGEVPSSISKLQQLEYLILRKHYNIVRDHPTCLPKEIWDMEELRHLRILGSKLADPSDCTQLPNLSTLYVNAHNCSVEVFRCIPHLKKLGIQIELHPETIQTISCFRHIGLLANLKSLKCVVVNPRLRSQVAAPPYYLINLPDCLKKLCLNGLGYRWIDLSLIGSMQNIEVLKLRCSAFQGPEWKTEHGEFRRLKCLLLEDMDVVQWRTTGKCFLSLQRLIIRHCYKLKAIPPVVGGAQTLRTMEVTNCSPSLVAAVHEIQERINSSLQVDIIASLYQHV